MLIIMRVLSNPLVLARLALRGCACVATRGVPPAVWSAAAHLTHLSRHAVALLAGWGRAPHGAGITLLDVRRYDERALYGSIPGRCGQLERLSTRIYIPVYTAHAPVGIRQGAHTQTRPRGTRSPCLPCPCLPCPAASLHATTLRHARACMSACPSPPCPSGSMLPTTLLPQRPCTGRVTVLRVVTATGRVFRHLPIRETPT